ncbi:MAG: LysE family translocator [Calditrichia bacterium]
MFFLPTESLLLFIAASIALLVTPGPAVLYIVTQSISQGTKAGIFSSLGLGMGGIVHVFAAAFGLSAILAASATAFTVVKLLGAAYLIFLGIQKFREVGKEAKPGFDHQPSSMRKIFMRGVWVNVLNPKAALFFLAFCPQFIDPVVGNPEIQMLFLGGLFLAIALITDISFAVFSGKVRRLFIKGSKYSRNLNYAAGSIYILMGIAAAFGSKD